MVVYFEQFYWDIAAFAQCQEITMDKQNFGFDHYGFWSVCAPGFALKQTVALDFLQHDLFKNELPQYYMQFLHVSDSHASNTL
jgi:hypothetical protein